MHPLNIDQVLPIGRPYQDAGSVVFFTLGFLYESMHSPRGGWDSGLVFHETGTFLLDFK
jgi:hypothetical protein